VSIAGWDEGTLERFVQDRTDPRLSGLLATALVRSGSGDPLVLSAGEVTLSFVASSSPTPVVVAHELGRVPVAVVMTSTAGSFTCAVSTLTADSFTATALCNTVTTEDRVFYWVAVG